MGYLPPPPPITAGTIDRLFPGQKVHQCSGHRYASCDYCGRQPEDNRRTCESCGAPLSRAEIMWSCT